MKEDWLWIIEKFPFIRYTDLEIVHMGDFVHGVGTTGQFYVAYNVDYDPSFELFWCDPKREYANYQPLYEMHTKRKTFTPLDGLEVEGVAAAFEKEMEGHQKVKAGRFANTLDI